MRSVVLGAMFAALLSPSIAVAQTVPLTEATALQRLSESSPRVRAIRATIDLARADVLAAGRWPNPRVTVDRESVARATEYLTMVGQLLPISGQRGLQVRAASALADAASSRTDDAVRRARADLRLAFAQLLAAQVRERELTSARDRLREFVEVLARREAAGDAAGFDRLRAEREAFDVEADRAAAATERIRAQAALAGFFGEPIDPASIVAVAPPAPRSPLPAVHALVEHAESTRGEVAALLKEIDAARFSLRAADRRRIPEPDVVAGTKSSSLGAGGLGSVVMVEAAIPLFDRGSVERASARARANQAEASIAVFRAVLRAEIAALHAAVLERRETAASYRSRAMSSADEIQRIAQVSYDAGERTILEVLDAYRTGATARVRQAALDEVVRQAEIELEYVSGWEIP